MEENEGEKDPQQQPVPGSSFDKTYKEHMQKDDDKEREEMMRKLNEEPIKSNLDLEKLIKMPETTPPQDTNQQEVSTDTTPTAQDSTQAEK